MQNTIRQFRLIIVGFLCLFIFVASDVQAQDNTTTVEAVDKAEQFLDSLSDSQRATVLFDFTDNRQRGNWSNLPGGIFARTGLRLGDMNDAQENAVMALLQAVC